tara:strand:+ start:98 stop:532 length:435 start_codon:yes stop_codon:yes gene_type:complete
MDSLYNNSWDNTHEQFLKLSKYKPITFCENAEQLELFDEVRNRFNANQVSKYKVMGKTAYKGICPACKKNTGFYMSTKDERSYQVVCPNTNCEFPNGKNGMGLKDIIKHYTDEDLMKRWKSIWHKKNNVYGWKGIRTENRKKKI